MEILTCRSTLAVIAAAFATGAMLGHYRHYRRRCHIHRCCHYQPNPPHCSLEAPVPPPPQSAPRRLVGVMSAMTQELELLLADMKAGGASYTVETLGRRDYYTVQCAIPLSCP